MSYSKTSEPALWWLLWQASLRRNHWCIVDQFIQVEVFRGFENTHRIWRFLYINWTECQLFYMTCCKRTANIISWQTSSWRLEFKFGLNGIRQCLNMTETNKTVFWGLCWTTSWQLFSIFCRFTEIYLWITMNSNVNPLWLNTCFLP